VASSTAAGYIYQAIHHKPTEEKNQVWFVNSSARNMIQRKFDIQ
jgi:hypothetical protein